MPQAIAGWIISAVGVASTGVAAALISAAVQLTAGLLLSSALGKKSSGARPPQDGRVLFTDAVGARTVHYGRVLRGGQVAFGRSANGFLHRVIIHGHGEIANLVELRINERQYTLEPDGRVFGRPFSHGVDGSLLRVETRVGAAPSVSYSGPTAAAPEWSAAHRMDGLWTTYFRCQQRGQENQQASYPNGAPSISWLADTSKVFDPRTGVLGYTDNAALVIADWLGHPDGFGRPGVINQAELTRAADHCDGVRALASGGTTALWRLAGSASLATEPSVPLDAMLDACAGDIRMRPDGELSLNVGGDPEPVITLTDDDVLEFLKGDDGPDALDRFTELPITYIDEMLNYVETTADPWVNQTQLSALGEDVISGPLDCKFAPCHAQARHAGKIHSLRANPTERRTIRYKISALPAIYERTVILDHPAMGLSGVWRVAPSNLSMSDMTVTLELEKVAGNGRSWEVSEEGMPQALPPEQPDTNAPPSPAGDVQAYGCGTAGNAGIYVHTEAPQFDDTSHFVAYRSVGGEWLQASTFVNREGTQAQISGLVDGGLYEIAVIAARTETHNPDNSEATDVRILGVGASSTSAVPDAPSGLSVVDLGAGIAQLEVTASASTFGRFTEITRGGDVVATLRTQPGASVTWSEAISGTHTWTARAMSLSGDASTGNPSAAETIT